MYGYGSVSGYGYGVNDTLGVRPALKLDLSMVSFDSATNTFSLAEEATTTTTVVWSSETGSFDQSIVSVGPAIEYDEDQWQLALYDERGIFTTSQGVFTKIEIDGGYWGDFPGNGEGWNGGVWTGSASSVPFSGCLTNAHGDNNFTITFTIDTTEDNTKQDPAATDFTFTAPSDLVYDGDAKSASVEAATGVSGMGEITVKYFSDDAFQTEVQAEDVKAPGTYYVAIDVTEGDDYNAVTNLSDTAWTFTITKAAPTASDFTFTAPTSLGYDGNAKTATVAVNDGITGMGTVTVKYYSDAVRTTEVTAANVKNAITYYVGIAVAEGTNYSAATALFGDGWDFTVTKADPTADAPTGVTATYGQTLADVALINPIGNTDGTWAWVDEGTTSVGSAGTNTFQANFTPTDDANYNGVSNVEVTVTVSVAPADQAAAEAVTDAISDLPAPAEIATTDRTDIESARAAYNALTDLQKTLISADTLTQLANAEKALAFAEYKDSQTTAADGKAVEGDSEACATLISNAKTTIAGLTYDTTKTLDANKAGVDAVLTALDTALADQRAADSVLALIADIPTQITKENAEAKVQAARAAYDALSTAQKKLVDEETLKKLTDSETVLAVAEQIDALPAATDVKDTDVTAIHEARDAFEALTDGQKAMLAGTVLTKLQDSETALISEVVSDITGITEITDENIAEVKDLLDFYDALTDEEKAAVNEKIGKEGTKKLADLEKAYDVAERISELKDAKDITAADSNDVSLVRTAYGLLSKSQQALVSEATLAKLEAAEAKLAELKEAEELEAAKTSALDRLNDYAEAKALANATKEEKEAYDKAVTDGQAAIAAAKDPAEVAAALTQAKAAVDAALAKIAEDRAAAEEMEKADKRLDYSKSFADYSLEDAKEILADEYITEEDKKAINDAIAKVEEAMKAVDEIAASETATAAEKNAAAEALYDAAEELDDAIYAAEDYIDEVKAAAEALAAAKKSASDRLDDYSEAKALADATPEEKAAYDKAVADGQAAIAAAKDPAEVATALTQAKAAVDAALATINADRAAAAEAAAEMAEADKAVEDAKTAAETAKKAAAEAVADKYATDADKTAVNTAKETLDAKIKAATDLPADATAQQKKDAAKAIEDAVKALNDKVDAANVNSAAAKAKAEEEATAAAQLEAAKKTASERLDDFAEAKAPSNATAEEQAAYDKAVADGRTAINAAADQDAVATALAEAKKAVKDAADKIEKAHADAAKDMETAEAALNYAIMDANYVWGDAEEAAADPYVSEADKQALSDAMKALEDAVYASYALPEDATAEEVMAAALAIVDNVMALAEVVDKAEVNSAVAKAAATEAEKLAAAKEAAIGRLDDYAELKAKEDATDAEKAEYDQAVAGGKAAIEAAEDKAAVAAALTEAKAAVNAALAKIDADRAAAAKVTKQIDGLSATKDITVDDKDSIEAARAAYDSLTDDQKAKVSKDTLKKLETAEATLVVVSKYSNEWVNGKWYNKDAKSKGWWFGDNLGWYAKNQWQKIDGKWYFFDKEGYMETNAYRQGYYLNAKGVWDGKAKVAGWKQDSKGWYYSLGGKNFLKNCWKKIDGKWYYFKANGYAAQKRIVSRVIR